MTQADATPLLSVRDLTVAFGRDGAASEVVRDVGFDVQAGETLAIVGESGSGKSVTALAINRLVDHAGGRIVRGAIRLQRPDGTAVDMARAPAATLRAIRGAEIGMIFQEPMTSLNPVHTVGQQVAESFALHHHLSAHAAMARAREALERVRIPDAARRLRAYPHQLSGGMRQRVMIAIALAGAPRLLIADEPTTALDVTIQAQIAALLAQLRDETGLAVIFITHDMGLVAEVADRVLVMHDGRVVEAGTVDAVFDQPSHAYTRHLLQSVPHFRHGGATRAPLAEPDHTTPSPATESPAAPMLRVRDLVVRFPVRAGLLRRIVGTVHAVEGVDLDLAAGETLAIVGESGSGKSTTARAILGLVSPDGGTIAVSPTAAPRPPKGYTQTVFQDPFASLNPRLKVRSLLAEPLVAMGKRTGAATVERMAGLLQRVGMPADCLDRYPHAFSGGQRQRLCIARALITDPRLVILDEAVSALDVSIQAQVLDLLLALQAERGLAYLFISHDMAVVERIAHRVAVMYAGRIVEVGSARRVLGQPAHAYTRRLIEAVPTTDRARRRRAFALDASEPPSLIMPPGYEPPPAKWRRVDTDHLVRVEATE